MASDTIQPIVMVLTGAVGVPVLAGEAVMDHRIELAEVPRNCRHISCWASPSNDSEHGFLHERDRWQDRRGGLMNSSACFYAPVIEVISCLL